MTLKVENLQLSNKALSGSSNDFFKFQAQKFGCAYRSTVKMQGALRKRLAYTCTQQDLCGGLGDRLKGFASTFVLALLLNAEFVVEWTHPVRIKIAASHCKITPSAVSLAPNFPWYSLLNTRTFSHRYLLTLISTCEFHWMQQAYEKQQKIQPLGHLLMHINIQASLGGSARRILLHCGKIMTMCACISTGRYGIILS